MKIITEALHELASFFGVRLPGPDVVFLRKEDRIPHDGDISGFDPRDLEACATQKHERMPWCVIAEEQGELI